MQLWSLNLMKLYSSTKKYIKKNCLLLRFDYITYVLYNKTKTYPSCNLLKRHLLINILKYIVFVEENIKKT